MARSIYSGAREYVSRPIRAGRMLSINVPMGSPAGAGKTSLV